MIRSSIEWIIEHHSSLAYVVGDDEALYRMPWQSQEG